MVVHPRESETKCQVPFLMEELYSSWKLASIFLGIRTGSLAYNSGVRWLRWIGLTRVWLETHQEGQAAHWFPRLLLYSLYLAMYCGMRLDLRLGLSRTRWFDAIGLESSSGYGVWSNCNVSSVRARISSCAMPWDIHDSSSVGSSIVLSGKCSTGSTWTLASFGVKDSCTCSRVGTFSSGFSSDSSDCWQKIAYV